MRQSESLCIATLSTCKDFGIVQSYVKKVEKIALFMQKNLHA